MPLCVFIHRVRVYVQKSSPKLGIDLVCEMEEIDNIHPVLADLVMGAGYHAIDVLYNEVSFTIITFTISSGGP